MVDTVGMNDSNIHESTGTSTLDGTTGILTVGQLRELLNGFHEDTHVVIADDNGWYNNISMTALPDGEGYCAVTFFVGDTFDARQI